MRVLLIFLDGIGLGDDDPTTNPFATANTPVLHALANGQRWLRDTGLQFSQHSVFIPTDAQLGVPGRPQSATGQAAILTGQNVPMLIGEHYGPKPNPAIRALLQKDNLFLRVVRNGKSAALVEAYPPPWHTAAHSGKMLLASYQFAAQTADLHLMDADDLQSGRALSGDWTGEGWRTQLGYSNTPLLSPEMAGQRLGEIARQYDFTFMPHWLTDVIGHRGSLAEGVRLLEIFDGVMRGLLASWDHTDGLIAITSDHGNLEKIGDRRHTENRVPTVMIGANSHALAAGLHDLTGVADRILAALGIMP